MSRTLFAVLILSSPVALGGSPAEADIDIGGKGASVRLGGTDLRDRAYRGFDGPVRQNSKMALGHSRAKETACFFSRPQAGAPRYEASFRCGARGIVASDPEEAAPPEEPELTEGDVRRAVSEIPMPALRVTVQPGGRTLVNVPTILHTDPRPVRESITLLGHDIDVEATPTRFTWHHGDGTSRTTTRPGRPYPAKDVTHTYQRTADRVSIRVDTTYTVRFRVDGAAWTPLGQPLTATGAATPLQVTEAAPVLVAPRR